MDNVLGSIVTAILAGLAIYATVSLIIYIILVIATGRSLPRLERPDGNL